MEAGPSPGTTWSGRVTAPAAWAGPDATLQSPAAAGAVIRQALPDVGGGKLTATVKDEDGNVIALIQPP